MKNKSLIKNFSAGNDKLFIDFADYWNHYRANQKKDTNIEYATVDQEGKPITFNDKETRMNKGLIDEIIRRSGVVDTDQPLEYWFNHPLVKHEAFAIVSAMIDMILPDTIIDSVGLYTDVRTIGYGDSQSFDVEPSDIFSISKAGQGQRTSEIKKQFKGQVTVVPENREITVGVSLYKVLSGAESLADFTAKAIRSIETQITLDSYTLFAATLGALPTTATTGLRVAGYSQASLTRLCEQVTAWNGGSKAVIVGTRLALVNVLPNDANYRYMLDSPYATLGYIPQAFGYDVMMLPQVADRTTEWALALDNETLWILSPASQKLVKLVLEGSTISNTTGTFDNAYLSQTAMFMKRWGVAIATNAIAGAMTL